MVFSVFLCDEESMAPKRRNSAQRRIKAAATLLPWFNFRASGRRYHLPVSSPAKSRILVVEDEESLREGLCDLLVFHGHQPLPAATGEEGLRLGLSQQVDLALLDVMLPGLSGFEVCARLRQAKPQLAILMLTAKGAEDDIVRGLKSGADDYLAKPFSLRELMARVAAQLRRAGLAARAREERFSAGGWQIDPGALKAEAAGQEVDLSPREVAILQLLHREKGKVVSRKQLLEEVWGLANAEQIETHTVEVHFVKLRQKLGGRAEAPIETVRGAGYRLVAGEDQA
jgi:DNA-binding response OmpR family regulator